MQKLARAAAIVALVLGGVVVIRVALVLVGARGALSAPDLSAGDRARIEAQGAAEAAYEMLLLGPAAAALGVRAWAKRRDRRA